MITVITMMMHAISVMETGESIITISTLDHMVLSEDMDVVVMVVVEGTCRILF